MPDGWKEVRWFRDRADELRQTAEEMTIPSAKDGLEQAARHFDKMADDLEQQLKARGVEEPKAD